MWKAALAGAFALATVSLSASGSGVGIAPAQAQDLILQESHIARLKHALHLTATQERHWQALEAVLRDIVQRQRSGDETGGLVQRVRARIRTYALDAEALARISAAARPLVASLDDKQRQDGLQVVQAMGFGGLF